MGNSVSACPLSARTDALCTEAENQCSSPYCRPGNLLLRERLGHRRRNMIRIYWASLARCVKLLFVVLIGLAGPLSAQEKGTVIEGYPPDVHAALEIRDRARKNAPREVAGFSVQYVFTVANKWIGANGQPPKVTVAFRGGD